MTCIAFLCFVLSPSSLPGRGLRVQERDVYEWFGRKEGERTPDLLVPCCAFILSRDPSRAWESIFFFC
jgi:hypothetical protein